MPDPLPLPPELQHLVEKRSQTDRRKKQRRRRQARRQVDLGPLGTLETAGDLSEAVLEERRRLDNRRNRPTRRAAARRKTNPPPPGP